jgi:NDP-sugar pyrophosphorylase family protein
MESEGAKSEFQVIVCVEDDDGRLFPLTNDVPKCLLPVGNRPLLAYTLDTIRSSGALEILVVAPNEQREQLSQFLNSYIPVDDKANIELVGIPSDSITGSADYVRAVSNKIRGDFIVVGSDMVTDINLAQMVRVHRLKSSDIVVCLTPFQFDDADAGDKDAKKSSEKVKKAKIDEEDQEYHGLCGDGRLVLKCATVECDKGLTFDKRLLDKCSDLTVRNDLIDIGVYVMSKWIVQLLLDHKKISSLKVELLPYLMNKQFITDTEYLLSSMGTSFLQRVVSRPLQDVDAYMYNLDRRREGQSGKTAEELYASSGSAKTVPAVASYVDLGTSVLNQFLQEADAARQVNSLTLTGNSIASAREINSITRAVSNVSMDLEGIGGGSLSLCGGEGGGALMKAISGVDMIRCFAMVATPAAAAADAADVGGADNRFICHRVSNVQTYLQLNRDVPAKLYNAAQNPNPATTAISKLDLLEPWADVHIRSSYNKKELSVYDSRTVEVQPKVLLKYCSIGAGVKIGTKSKLNNCVAMDGVTVGEK